MKISAEIARALRLSAIVGAWLSVTVTVVLAANEAGAETKSRLVLFKESKLAKVLDSNSSGVSVKNLKVQTHQLSQQLLGEVSAQRQSTELWLLGGLILSLSDEDAKKMAQNSIVAEVRSLDRKPHLVKFDRQMVPTPAKEGQFTYGLERIRVPELQKVRPELDGRGVTVGIIDTGADSRHPDLKNRVLAFQDFTSKKSKNPIDDHGHGTHVAGTVAGGFASGTQIGVAPGAHLIIAKAFDRDGNSTEEGLLKALQWMADPDGKDQTADNPQVLSDSWEVGDGMQEKNPSEDPFCKAIDRLESLGTAVVFAAGNSGPNSETINIPGACPNAITVAATDESDGIAYFSSRGPVRWKTQTLAKPDVAAPGVEVYSAAPGGGYQHMSGTSMATPHVAGSMALLTQAFPNLSVADRKRILKDTAQDFGSKGADMVYGSGRVDLIQAVNAK